MFASMITKNIPVPGDPDNSVLIGKLSGSKIRKSRKVAQLNAMKDFREMGGAQFLKEVEAIGGVQKAAADAQENPLNGHDLDTVLNGGIKAWTYDRPVSAETIDDMDGETQEAIAREILALGKRTEDQEKNDVSGSTAS